MSDAKNESENSPRPLNARDSVLFKRGNLHLHIDQKRKRRVLPFAGTATASGVLATAPTHIATLTERFYERLTRSSRPSPFNLDSSRCTMNVSYSLTDG